MPKKYNKDQPILVLIRRGRRGRGFSVSPVEDISNPAACQSTAEMGEVIEEMLDDESQPRVNVNELLAAATSDDRDDRDDRDDDEDYDDEDEDDGDRDEGDEEEEDEGIMSGVIGSADPADTLLFNLFHAAVKKGQSMSSKPRTKPRSRQRRRRKKPSKK